MLDFLIAVKKLRDKLTPSKATVTEVLSAIAEDVDNLVAAADQFKGQDKHYLSDLAYIVDKLDVIAIAAQANGAVKPEPVEPVIVMPIPPAPLPVTPPIPLAPVPPAPAPVVPTPVQAPAATVAPQAAPVAPVAAPAAK